METTKDGRIEVTESNQFLLIHPVSANELFDTFDELVEDHPICEQYREELFGVIAAAADNSTPELSDVWDTLASPVYLVVDERGDNIEGAQIRRINAEHWLSVDGVDGYSVLSQAVVDRLCTTKLDAEVRSRRMNKYLTLTNSQSPSGRWTIYADDQGTIVGLYDYPDDVRGHLAGLELDTVAMDVDGNGSIRQVPIEWIGDGEPLIGSDRALSLVTLG